MHHEPNRFVANACHAMDLMSRHPFLAGTEQVGREKPAMERDVRILKHCSDCDTELLAASVALPDTFTDGFIGTGPCFKFARVIDFSAVRADGAIGPADRFIELAGAVFVADSVRNRCELEAIILIHWAFLRLRFAGKSPKIGLGLDRGLTPAFWISPDSCSSRSRGAEC